MIRRALLSVSDKTGLDELGRFLSERGVEILSSGGTARFLAERKIPVTEVAEFTAAPEMLDGRVKTLHPKIHGGILAVRDNPEHMKQLESQGYLPIDLVVVNLYPFERTVKSGAKDEEAIENIDIGGPAMLRSAAKNHASVTVLVDPAQYAELIGEMNANGGATTAAFRRRAAQRVFERTAAYDAVIAEYFRKDSAGIPDRDSLALEKKWSIRYGENPHQAAGFYLPARAMGETVLNRVIQGKQLSYNNLLDVHAALDLILEFSDGFTTAILKHTNPCGVGTSTTSLAESYERALEADPVSAFGGIVVFSSPVDAVTAKACSELFTEIVIAPGFSAEALTVFAKKKNLRLLEVDFGKARTAMGGRDIRRAADGYLVQERDRAMEDLSKAKTVTKRNPAPDELRALGLAWKVCKHVKSNAIVLASGTATLGIGAGQMSRIDSSRFASIKAEGKSSDLIVLASDAFFPFRDSIDSGSEIGVTAVVQPGGSVRDEEVIRAADEHGMAMLFTGVRHFRH